MSTIGYLWVDIGIGILMSIWVIPFSSLQLYDGYLLYRSLWTISSVFYFAVNKLRV